MSNVQIDSRYLHGQHNHVGDVRTEGPPGRCKLPACPRIQSLTTSGLCAHKFFENILLLSNAESSIQDHFLLMDEKTLIQRLCQEV